MSNMHIREYTWVGIEVAVNSIAMQMFKDEWRPDYIVGITRGGLVPAVLLSHATDIPMKTLCVQLESKGLDENTERNAEMAKHALKEYKKILIIDDNSDIRLILNEINPNACESVPDPYYDGENGFQNIYNLLNKACDKIVQNIE